MGVEKTQIFFYSARPAFSCLRFAPVLSTCLHLTPFIIHSSDKD